MNYTSIIYKDTHGGFHGDGSYYAKFNYTDVEAQSFITQLIDKNWNAMPLTENLNLIMYGGTRGNVTYNYNLATNEANFPSIEHGYWLFIDRHSESDGSNSDTDLFRRHSYNFTLAMFDTDTNILYYFEFDT